MKDIKDITALIDADTLVYISALNNQIEDCNELHMSAALEEVDTKLQYIATSTRCNFMELHLTGSNNYRYGLYSEYKANRKDKSPPSGLIDLKQEVVTRYNAVIHTDIEADDYVVWAKNNSPTNYTLVAIDKDVINSCVGVHYNYYFKDPKNVEVSLDTAIEWSLFQTIKGDSIDNIKGVAGFGEVKTRKFLDSIKHLDLYEKLCRISGLFSTETEFVMNYNLASCHLFDGSKVNIAKSFNDVVILESSKIEKLKKSASLLTSNFI